MYLMANSGIEKKKIRTIEKEGEINGGKLFSYTLEIMFKHNVLNSIILIEKEAA